MTNYTRDGYIYFLRVVGYGGSVKIGFSKNPAERMKALVSEAGVPLRLIGQIRGVRADEAVLHAILRHRRLHGEWFDTGTKELHDFIARLIRGRRLPREIVKNASRYHEDLGGSRGICKCGRPK